MYNQELNFRTKNDYSVFYRGREIAMPREKKEGREMCGLNTKRKQLEIAIQER